MAVVNGALFSLSASGTIARTLTYGNWKGIPYARQRVTPANPRSTEQTKTRQSFAFLQELYKFLPSIGREPWEAATVGIPMTPINMLIAKNNGLLRDEIDLDLLVMSPGARGGIPPASIAPTPGSGTMTVAVTAPTIPSGWSITAAQGLMVLDQDPHATLEATPVAAEDTTSTYSLVFSGLTGSAVYQLGVWLKWETPNGDAAYSVALRDQVTPS